jgi:hypothetical protein
MGAGLSSPSKYKSTSSLLITSSPPYGTALRIVNVIFNEAVFNAARITPVQKHESRLNEMAEYIHQSFDAKIWN